MDEATIDRLARKVGGRFKLATLIMKRRIDLMRGSQPLVEAEDSDFRTVLKEIDHDLIRLAERLPVDKLPLLAITSRNSDPDCRRFYEVLLRRHAPVMAYFWWGGTRYLPVSRTGTFPNVIRLDVARNKPLLAFSTEEALRVVREGRMGAFNLEFRWREVLDAPDRFEATILCARWREGRSRGPADIALIRPQRFRIERGRRYAWQAVGPDRKPLQRGTVQSDDQDLLVLPGINVAEAGIRIVVVPEVRR